MSRLTMHTHDEFGYAEYQFGAHIDEQDVLSRVGKIEDILYSPDGTELITLDRLRELVQAEKEGRVCVLPCKVGDTLYAIADCADIIKLYDFTGTGAIECPFEKDCTFEECDDGNRRVFETVCNGFLIGNDCNVFLDYINTALGPFDFGKTVFLARAEAEEALKGDKS